VELVPEDRLVLGRQPDAQRLDAARRHGRRAFCPTPAGTPSAEERRCTDINCYLGPPIEIGKAAINVAPCNNIAKVCGLNVVGSPTVGSLTCGTGNMSATFRVDKRIYCGACPRCTAAPSDRAAPAPATAARAPA
jgi:hypothetical protein